MPLRHITAPSGEMCKPLAKLSYTYSRSMVKEEIVEDDAKLPCFNGRVVSWLVTAEGSNASDGTSQCTDRCDVRSPMDRTGGPHDLRPPSYHSHLVDNLCDSTCTETESVISSRRDHHGFGHYPTRHREKHFHEDHGRINGHNKHGHGQKHRGGHAYETSSMVTSDIDTTSFVDSEDETTSRISTTTGESSVSKIHARQRRRRRRHRIPPMSRVRRDNCSIANFQDGTSSISSITESTMSLNIITVTLNIGKEFLNHLAFRNKFYLFYSPKQSD
ncbi:segment polarity protein dishevelled homolog DVL-3-like [Limulus polyphemus]|uniref:Segment polarity protein dishevelled homolog DVL-3-like n=1 Tax=Limulus polyphemus TaxID=6850 RepID=A0ABM1TP02_LIMPO|nr:segment polarity protein dishevelled homolog DVL-3-like [Limulus polyphemus]